MADILVRKFHAHTETIVENVPASKSILNRALLLSALAKGDVMLRTGQYGDDSRAALGCLHALGVRTELTEAGILVHGCGGNFNANGAVLDVGSAGTVARFFPAALAFCGGTYRFTASEQMMRRPMGILRLLESAGVQFTFEGEPYAFPFVMRSEGVGCDTLTVDTAESTQYASALMMAASVKDTPTRLILTGPRTRGSYLRLTFGMLGAFHIKAIPDEEGVTVCPAGTPPTTYDVEPDISGACYLYAISLLCGARVMVPRTHLSTTQGDIRLLRVLEEKGVRLTETAEGLVADGRNVPFFNGFDYDMQDFSDQALTVAALALFATSPSILRGIGHIRNQECDRIAAIVENCNALGARAFTNGNDVFIEPAPLHGGTVKTFNDHRVAMAFALVGLKTGNVVIENADCCKKTFEGYFELLDRISR